MKALAIRERMANDFYFYAKNFLKIKTKGDGIASFALNHVQRFIHEKIEEQKKKTGKVRVIILKARQQGCSTFIGGRYYWKVTHQMGSRAFILSHSTETTHVLFDMVKRFHENIQFNFRVSVDTKNAKQLKFDKLDSSFGVGTAGTAHTGRGDSIHFLHASEVAYWENAAELVAGLLQCVPDKPGTECIFESTSKGQNNFFHTFWGKAVRGEIEYEPIFIPWYWLPEYKKELTQDFVKTEHECEIAGIYGLSDEQIQWRRDKIAEFELAGVHGETLFKWEYPINPEEAFQAADVDSFIKTENVLLARKRKTEGYGPLIVGVDPATKAGKDRTVIVKRQGRRAFDLEIYRNIDTMETVGNIVRIIKKFNPDRVNIDVIGIGRGVVDRLIELGYGSLVKPINAAAKTFYPDRYINKRHEMYDELRKWFENEVDEVSVPNSDELQMDVCSLTYTYDSNGRFKLVDKDKLDRSPDTADALALTFAEPVTHHKISSREFMNPLMRL